MSASWTDGVATLADGRKIGFVDYGDPAGRPAFHFHGALTSRWEGFWLGDAARACGVRLISVDRPGIGNSCLKPGRCIADWPSDVAEIATHFGWDRFSIVGVSGGGPYALACAAALPERVERVLLIAGAAPLSDPAVFALLSARQRMTLGRLIHSPKMLRAVVFALSVMPQFARVLALGATLGGLSSADLRTIRSPEVAAAVKRMPPEAAQAPFGSSVDGAAWDGHLHSHPWGFTLESIRVPVTLWYAEDDRIVPARMGRWLASRLPVNTAHFLPDDGHISLILGRAAEYLRELGAAPLDVSRGVQA
jgi:pimeloyl-ACP methyl ester carboxylesterase